MPHGVHGTVHGGLVIAVVLALVGCEEPLAPPPEEPPPDPPEEHHIPAGTLEFESCEEAFRDPRICGGCVILDDDTVYAGICIAEAVLDKRCPYGIRIYDPAIGSRQHQLLDQVSDFGTLCATANYEVSRSSLNQASRMSHAMLKRNPELVASMAPPILYKQLIGGYLILLYSGENWCDDGLPEIYASHLQCDRPSFGGGGMFASPIILCPENNLAICVHEIAHAAYKALAYMDSDPEVNHQDPIVDRFADLDIEDLWSGYATEDVWEFFAEMSAIYFGANLGVTFPSINGAAALRAYDPATYEVIHAIYRGSVDLRQVLR